MNKPSFYTEEDTSSPLEVHRLTITWEERVDSAEGEKHAEETPKGSHYMFPAQKVLYLSL
jgi:hypothetical protein